MADVDWDDYLQRGALFNHLVSWIAQQRAADTLPSTPEQLRKALTAEKTVWVTRKKGTDPEPIEGAQETLV